MTGPAPPNSLKAALTEFSLSSPRSEEDLESARQELRSLSKQSLYLFSKAVLNYPKLSPKLHLDVTEILQRVNCPKHPKGCKRKIIVLPRGHLKTTICTKSYAIWRYLRNQDIRILIANEKAENAEHMLREIKGQFEANELFRWLFPEAIPDFAHTKWREGEILLPRTANFSEGSIETIGVGGTVVSRHYNLIILDDLVGMEATLSSEVMARTVDWYKYVIGLLNSPREDEVLYVGNRWGYNDIVSHILENEKRYDTVVRAVLENGEPIWPEEFDQETIDGILDTQGPKIFSCQYMNDPKQENPASFEEDWLRYYTVPPVALRTISAVDPAIGETSQSDYSAISTLGMDVDRNIYMLELTRDRLGVDELCEEIIRHHLTHRSTVILEAIFFQRVLYWPLREAMRRYNITIPVTLEKALAPGKKIARIAAMHPFFARGQFYIPREGIAGFRKEYREFPAGAHDDAMDATALALQHLTAPSGIEAPQRDPLSYEALKAEIEEKRWNTPSGPWAYHKEVRA